MTLPRFDQRPVGMAPLAGVRVPTNIPAASIDVPSMVDLRGLEENAAAIFETQRRRTFNTQLLEADNQLASLATDLRTNATQLRGKNAMGALDNVDAAWRKGVAKISGALTTDEQLQAFQQRASTHWASLEQTVATHAAQEHERYIDETTNDAVRIRTQAASDNYQNPDLIQQQLAETRGILQDYGKGQGWSAETLKAKTTEAVTQIHAGVIERMIANHQDIDAVAYLTVHRDEMSGAQLTRIEQQVETGSTLGAAQRSRDVIVKSAPTLSAALEQAGRIQDPRVRQETEEQVRRYYEDQNTSARLNEAKLLQQAGQVIQKTGNFNAIPVAIRSQLTPAQIDGLKAMERALTKKSSDMDTLNQLRNTAGLHPDDFAKLDLSLFMDALSPADYKSLAAKQLSMRLSTHGAEQRAAKSDVTRLNKQLNAKKAQRDQFQSLNLPVPPQLLRDIHALTDSVHSAIQRQGPQANAGAGTSPTPPPVPGAPIQRAPAPIGGVKLSPLSPAPSGSSGSGEPDQTTASVPPQWLQHAATDPDYAAYLATMGVEVG